MPVYSFQGYDLDGKGISGSEFAESPPILEDQLSQRGIVVESYACKRQARGVGRVFSRRKIKPQELLLLMQELVSLLRAGFPVPKVIQMSSDRPDQPALQGCLQDVLLKIEQGQSLSEACAQHKNFFDKYLLTSMRIGEKSGDLVGPLQRYTAYLQVKIRLAQGIKQAMVYPLFLIITMVFVIIALFTFVLPRFVEMYSGFNAELPAPTLILMDAVDQFPLVLVSVLIIISTVVIFYKASKSTRTGKLFWDNLFLKLPLAGRLIKLFYIAQISRIMATLLKSGVPMVAAVNDTAEGINNSVLSEQLIFTAKKIEEGESLSSSLRNVKIFPQKALKLVSAGEESGQLEDLLINITEFHEQLFEVAIKKIVALVEPVIMLLIGLFVGGIILVMYLPIFSVADIIQ